MTETLPSVENGARVLHIVLIAHLNVVHNIYGRGSNNNNNINIIIRTTQIITCR